LPYSSILAVGSTVGRQTKHAKLGLELGHRSKVRSKDRQTFLVFLFPSHHTEHRNKYQ
jgi:hypothetical protein